MGKKLTTNEFIDRAKEIHGDKFDYSEAVYINARTKVKIICPIHGDFLQTPDNHLRGNQCPKCSQNLLSKRFSKGTDTFIKEARFVHGNKYDYSLVNYKNCFTKVNIICPEHGNFLQTPHDHLAGSGCPLCGNISIAEKKKDTRDSFIDKATEVHGTKYDYSKVEYINSQTKVEIICPEHGPFFQIPNSHLSGTGCPMCANNQKSDLATFIKKAVIIHNGKYDYSKVVYLNNRTKVKIICPEHGEFYQTPHSHLSGYECQKCGNVKMLQHSFISKKENKSFISSKYENNFLEKISKLYPNTKTNYNNDERYPFMCDFYIPERDLFIELNIHWTHNPKFGWYNKNLKSHQKNLQILLNRALTSRFYKNAIDVWTGRDVLKRKTAQKNNLNYVVLWNEQDIEDWFALGCPDGHDGDGMYTWKEKFKDD